MAVYNDIRIGAPGADADFVIDVLDVVADGFRGDDESGRHFFVGEAACDEAQHLNFALAQLSRRRLARGKPRSVPGGGQHGIGCPLVELAGASLAAQLAGGGLGREGGPVRAQFRHRAIRIGGGKQAGVEGQ